MKCILKAAWGEFLFLVVSLPGNQQYIDAELKSWLFRVTTGSHNLVICLWLVLNVSFCVYWETERTCVLKGLI